MGGKITGAGGGGFLLLYCERPHREAVRKALRKKACTRWPFLLIIQGAQVVVNDPFIDNDELGGSRWMFVPAVARATMRRSQVLALLL